jgi:hypothetical protein
MPGRRRLSMAPAVATHFRHRDVLTLNSFAAQVLLNGSARSRSLVWPSGVNRDDTVTPGRAAQATADASTDAKATDRTCVIPSNPGRQQRRELRPLNGRQLRNDLKACEPARHDHDVARTFTRRAVGDAQIAVSRIPRLREHCGSVSRGAGRVPLSCDLPEQKGEVPALAHGPTLPACATSRPSTPSCDWWRLCAVRLGSGAARWGHCASSLPVVGTKVITRRLAVSSP